MKYRIEIDGLRALSVIPVILYHFKVPGFQSGFLGVDIFFVISGYLISRLILESNNEFKFRAFYIRRARRILPLLLLTTLITLPFAFYILSPSHAFSFFKSVIGIHLLAPNFVFWKEAGYFDSEIDLKPLIHTWSLGVEEQFYIIFPAFFYFFYCGYQHKKHRRLLIPIIMLASFLLCFYAADWRPVANFYLLPSRVWEFLAGTCCVLIERSYFSRRLTSRLWIELLSLSGLMLVLYSLLFLSPNLKYPSEFTIPVVLGACLIILFGHKDSLAHKILSLRLFVHFGILSYSLYLVHQPIYALFKYNIGDGLNAIEVLCCLFSIYLISRITFKYVETTCRNQEVTPNSEAIKWGGIFSVFMLSTSLLVLFNQAKYTDIWLKVQPIETQETYALLNAAKKNMNYAWNIDDQDAVKNFGVHGDTECRFDVENITIEIENRILKCHDEFGKGIVIIGDSHAVDLFGMVIANSTYPFIIGLSQGGCRPHTYNAKCQYDAFEKFIIRFPHLFSKIVFEQAGFYLMRTKKMSGSREMFLDYQVSEPVVGIYPDRQNINLTYAYLRRISQINQVVWFGPRVEPQIRDTILLKLGCRYDLKLRPNQLEIFMELDDYLSSTIKIDDNIQYISQVQMLNLKFPEDFWNCNHAYWADEDHYSAIGEMYFGSRLDMLKLLSHPNYNK